MRGVDCKVCRKNYEEYLLQLFVSTCLESVEILAKRKMKNVFRCYCQEEDINLFGNIKSDRETIDFNAQPTIKTTNPSN